MKIVFVGSVSSSAVVLTELIAANMDIQMVFGLDETYASGVSGFYPIYEIAREHGVPYTKIKRINDPQNRKILEDIQPDYIFIVGLSQLVDGSLISIPKQGVIGFHPTPLPKHRGRAAMVWQMLLGVRETKCSMFFIDEGMDSGDIIDQEPYMIEETDYAEDVEAKLLGALVPLTKRVVEQINENRVTRKKQNEAEATYLLKRSAEDGRIDWALPIKQIHCLIRAVSKPYPGAFSVYNGNINVIFWRASMLVNQKYIGMPGQIAKIEGNSFYIVCKDGLLHVEEYETNAPVKFRVGHKFSRYDGE